MLYNFNATGYNSITPGLKKLLVDTGLESILIPGTPVTLISDPYVMYGNVVSYNQTKLIVDVGKTNTKEQNLFFEKWNIEIEGEFKKQVSEETQAPVENPYTPPVTPYTPPVTPYTPPVTPYTPPVTPYTPPVTPYTPPVTPYTPPVTPYTPPVTPFTPSGGIATTEPSFLIRYKIPILVLTVALIIGIIYFFMKKNGTYSANNFIAAFGDIL